MHIGYHNMMGATSIFAPFQLHHLSRFIRFHSFVDNGTTHRTKNDMTNNKARDVVEMNKSHRSRNINLRLPFAICWIYSRPFVSLLLLSMSVMS